jgi:hypothetical protein
MKKFVTGIGVHGCRDGMERKARTFLLGSMRGSWVRKGACLPAAPHTSTTMYPSDKGCPPPGELLLLLLLSVNLLPAALVRERAGVGITAGGGVVGGQGEGGGRDAAGAVAEPAEEGAGAAAHKNRAPWALDARDLRGARRFGRGWEGSGLVPRGRRGVRGSGGGFFLLLSSSGGAVHGQDTC